MYSHRSYAARGTSRPSRSNGRTLISCTAHNTWTLSAPDTQGANILQPWSRLAMPLLQAAAVAAVQLQLASAGYAAELIESNVNNEGNIPSELSAAGETAAPKLSSLLAGTNKKQIEGCTRKCVPTCIRGGEGAPGLGPISMRKEIVVFKDGFRSRQYCLSECAQVCSLIVNKESSSSSSRGTSGSSSSSSSNSVELPAEASAATTATAVLP